MNVGDSNSSGASGTSDCTGVPSQFNIGSNSAPPRNVPTVNAEMETTLTRPSRRARCDRRSCRGTERSVWRDTSGTRRFGTSAARRSRITARGSRGVSPR